VRIAIDYRPALRARTGVGEYIHQVAAALAKAGRDDITLFSSSWKDRLPESVAAELPHVRLVDRRIPVRALNLAWHRLEWPSIENLTSREFDIAHSPHPLLMPSQQAAAVVTIHDVHFLSHPERTTREIRRDYPGLAASHARRADRIIVSSRYASGEVQRRLGVPAEKIAVCPAGAPSWPLPVGSAGENEEGYILFMGTLEERKNVGGLLTAYGKLLGRSGAVPRLVMAGAATPDAAAWLEKIAQSPFAGHVDYLGYIDSSQREQLFKKARLFVLPSFEEGFGLPALEAMAAGVPVVVSQRGSLPEVVGDAGLLVDPDDADNLADAMARIFGDRELSATCSRRGLERARQFTWTRTAQDVRRAYEDALAARQHSSHAHRN
jgi:alpha-1,3-rhamnosyl/mannosyltransferase